LPLALGYGGVRGGGRWKGNLRIVLSTELIQRSILVEIDVSPVVPIHRCAGENLQQTAQMQEARI
jgi:hypothetical protein